MKTIFYSRYVNKLFYNFIFNKNNNYYWIKYIVSAFFYTNNHSNYDVLYHLILNYNKCIDIDNDYKNYPFIANDFGFYNILMLIADSNRNIKIVVKFLKLGDILYGKEFNIHSICNINDNLKSYSYRSDIDVNSIDFLERLIYEHDNDMNNNDRIFVMNYILNNYKYNIKSILKYSIYNITVNTMKYLLIEYNSSIKSNKVLFSFNSVYESIIKI